jgi:purine-binding chemotaxis protein CheW
MKQWCVVNAGDQCYGVNVERVLEVVRDTTVERVPGAPQGVRGLVNLRGQLVVALDVAHLVEDREQPTERGGVAVAVVVSHMGESLALCVDRVQDVRDVEEVETVPPPSGSGGLEKVSNAVAIDGEQIIAELDIERLVARVGRQR